MTTEPLVSIITPVFNSGRFIEDTLTSVLNQSYQNWEMIMVDDASTDESVAVINQYIQTDRRFILIKLDSNKGSGVARNIAIKAAKGRYIAFLDSDDIWTNERLKKHVKFMLDNKHAFSHTSYGYIDEKTNIIKSTFHVSKHPVSYTDLLKRTEISCLTAIYDTKYLGKMYMPDIRRKQDYALWLSILKSGHLSFGLDEVLAYYRQHNNSATNSKHKLILSHIQFLKETQKLNYIKSVYYTLHWAINGFIKYYIK